MAVHPAPFFTTGTPVRFLDDALKNSGPNLSASALLFVADFAVAFRHNQCPPRFQCLNHGAEVHADGPTEAGNDYDFGSHINSRGGLLFLWRTASARASAPCVRARPTERRDYQPPISSRGGPSRQGACLSFQGLVFLRWC